MQAIRATPSRQRAIHAVAELLGKLRIESIFVGAVARSAWLGEEVAAGAVDVLALMNAPQKNQLAMMASNRGFRVDREELDESIELDLVPLNFIDGDAEVRVHVLLATNALYGRMVSAGVAARLDDRELRVPAAEDLALLALVGDDAVSVHGLASLPDFDRRAFNERLVSIGLGDQVTAE